VCTSEPQQTHDARVTFLKQTAGGERDRPVVAGLFVAGRLTI
jgi:hypothetical protein